MNSYNVKHIKESPENRVCVIDFLPSVKQSIIETFKFFTELNVPSTFFLQNKKDTINVFYYFLLNNLCKTYETTKTKYRKVVAVYPIQDSAVSSFFSSNIKHILKVCPVKWCYASSMKDEELFTKAAISAEKSNVSYSKLFKFAETHNLKALKNKIQKNRIYSNILVDFSGVQN